MAGRISVLTLIVGLLLAGSAAAAPRPGVFSGALGVAVPAGATAEVRAVDRSTGEVEAASTVAGKGAFTLRLPAGSYYVAGALIPRPGHGAARRIGVAVSLRAGQRRRGSKLTARRKRPVRHRKAVARETYRQERGQVTPGRVAVQIPKLTGATGEMSVLNAGIADMLITDVVRRDCVTVREVSRIGDVINEIALSQSPYADPSTAIRRNFVISDVEVRGTLRNTPSGLDYTVAVVDRASGETVAELTGALDSDRMLEDIERLGASLNDELCDLSDVYRVTLDVQGTFRGATHDATGSVHATLLARRGTGAEGKVWRDDGGLAWGELAYAPKIGCAYIDPVPGASPWSVTITDGGQGRLRVAWALGEVGSAATSTATVDCPPEGTPPVDPPPIPGQPGPSLLGVGPVEFTVPYAGGQQAVSGEVSTAGDGFFNSGTVTVTPLGIAKRR